MLETMVKHGGIRDKCNEGSHSSCSYIILFYGAPQSNFDVARKATRDRITHVTGSYDRNSFIGVREL